MKKVFVLFIMIASGLYLHSSISLAQEIRDSSARKPDGVLAVDSLNVPSDLQESALGGDNLEALVGQLVDADELPILELVEEESPRLSRTVLESRSRFSHKLQPARGFVEGKYFGSSIKSYQRVKFSQGENLAAAFIMEKDAGESRLNDFLSGYVQIKNLIPSSSIVLGDYFIEAGQGVGLWRGFDYQKGANVVLPVQKKGRGLVPYASSDENAFLRGAATTLNFSKWSLTGYYSNKSLSASVDSNGNVTSLYDAGYFRTESEREKRSNLSERLLGARGVFRFSRDNTIGVTAFTAHYSRDFSLANERFAGNTLNFASGDYFFSLSRVKMFGEWAMTNHVVGGISGIHLEPDNLIDIISAYRNYPAELFDPYNGSFSERSGTANERGFYLGLQIRPVRGVRFAGYFDQFSFPAPAQGIIFPEAGHEIFLQAEVSPVRRLLFTPRYRRKVISESGSMVDQTGRTVVFDEEKVLESFRLTLDYRLDSDAKLRTRVEYVDLHFHPAIAAGREHGMLIYQDVVVRASAHLTLDVRLAIFRTDSFESGVAEYERDLLGVLTIPVLYGRGVRWYLLANYSMFESLQLSLKYVELIRDDVKTIGSGLDELPGNRDNRISLQLDFTL